MSLPHSFAKHILLLLGFFCLPCNLAHADLLDPLDFTPLGTLNLFSGNYTFDTDALTIVDDTDPGMPLFTGVVDNQNGMASPGVIPEIAVFTFADLDLASSANITVSGTRALALLSHSDIDIDTVIQLNGDGPGNQCNGSCVGEAGGPGGFAGGLGFVSGVGPGGGGGSQHNTPGNDFSGAGAGFGSLGQAGHGILTAGAGGAIYGNPVDTLQGGSGGGGGDNIVTPNVPAGGGGGGGALEVGAIGTVTIGSNGVLEVNGGAGNETSTGAGLIWGGNGSGGGIRIHGASLDRLGAIRALGGTATTFGDQAAGGGGRVLVSGDELTFFLGNPISVSNATQGIDVSPGIAQGGAGALNHGAVTIAPELTIVPSDETFELGSSVVVQTASTTQPRVDLIHRSLQITGNGEVTVPTGGYTNEFEFELRSTEAKITGTGADTLTNQSVLRGTGVVEAPVVNSAGGEINAVNDTLTFTQAVTSNLGAQINAINSTLNFNAGLTNNGDLNLINSTVSGALTAASGPIVAAGDNTLSGPVVGSGDFIKQGTGTLTLSASGTHTGATLVEAGTLRVGPGGRIFDASTVTVNSGATLRYEIGTADAIFGLNGDGDVDLINSNLVLGNFIAPANVGGVGTFSGSMTGDANGRLEKRGSGSFTFAGTGTYGGLTEVENGEFILTGSIVGTSNVNVIDGALAGGGTLSINGGSLTTPGTTTIGTGATLNLTAGQLTTSTLIPTGTFNMTGGRLVADTVSGDLTIAGGTLASGDSPGLTAVSGNYDQQATATLEIEIGGATAETEFDLLDVTGTATLAGTLDVSLIDLGGGVYTPKAGDSFEILTASSLSGTFAGGELLPALTGLLAWNVNYDTVGNRVVLEVLSPFSADFDGDGDVDGDDLTDPVDGWQARYGNDLNGLNFLAWQSQFGSGAPPLAASTTVPEPTTLMLVAIVMLILSTRQKRAYRVDTTQSPTHRRWQLSALFLA